MRKVDTVARWGGEEFVVLLPRTKKEDSHIAAERILNAISEYTFTGIDKQVTVSIGIASIPDPSIDTAEKLVDASDVAMYEAKRKRTQQNRRCRCNRFGCCKII